ncbi:MAG: NAD-dependent epimerase/dehydratase family protein, partial [Candidatus Saganbacteria bacterium]|nr:NAD-dependent epimerase/dehydratase family protein [Candidatus Saganbacteria bacterium]
IGVDSLNDYYDVNLKLARNEILEKNDNYRFYHLDLCDYQALGRIFADEKVDKICHLAAQPGVRFSITDPFAYQKSNNEAFLNIIECARNFGIKQFVYASSSSVYGANTKVPFCVADKVDKPISLYAATKVSNELVAHVYSHLYGINTIGLRFFTVYGPWGRPDMAYFIFTQAILQDEPIKVFNRGEMRRDFTYIDDIVQGVLASLDYEASYEVFNLGNDRAENLMDFIACIEKNLDKKAKLEMLPMQPGEVCETWADIGSSRQKLGFDPKVNINVGIKRFVEWYKKDYVNLEPIKQRSSQYVQ